MLLASTLLPNSLLNQDVGDKNLLSIFFFSDSVISVIFNAQIELSGLKCSGCKYGFKRVRS